MKIDPVPMECSNFKKETTHSVSFIEHAKAAGTLSAICSACRKTITMPLTGMRRRASISEVVQNMSKIGSQKRKIVKGDF